MPIPLEQDTWILGNEEDSVNLWSLGLWTPGFLYDFAEASQVGPVHHVFEFVKGHMRWFIPAHFAEEMSHQLLARVLERPNWYGELRSQVVSICDELTVFSQKCLAQEATALSMEELLARFAEHRRLICAMLGVGMISTLTEIPHSLFTNHVMALLEQRISEKGLSRHAAEYLMLLSAIPEEGMQRLERKHLYQMVQAIGGKREALPSIETVIAQHVKDFAWAYYGYEGPVLTCEHIVRDLEAVIQSGIDIAVELQKMADEPRHVEEERTKAEQELALTEYEKSIFEALRNTVFMKLYRKDAASFSFYAMEPTLREFAKRIGVSYEEVTYIAPGEHPAAVESPELRAALKGRMSYLVYDASQIPPRVLAEKEGREFIAKIYQDEVHGEVNELKGQCACIGTARGIARIVNLPSEMSKLNSGDILISIATTPDIVPAMKKAGAIVTEQGGITSHAAIVSRELNVPCVIGTRIATKVIHDGDEVEVDATRGTVKVLKRG